MVQLRHYSEQDNNGEYIIIVTDTGAEDVNELTQGDTLLSFCELEGDFTSWPTDRVLRQET